MRAFQVLLVVMFLGIVSYTGIVAANHGGNPLPIFFGDMIAMNWPGQFNFDFMGFLLLSGLWVSWRHRFSAGGIALGIVAFFGGIFFLSLYLLFVSSTTKGDVKELLLGKIRAQT